MCGLKLQLIPWEIESEWHSYQYFMFYKHTFHNIFKGNVAHDSLAPPRVKLYFIHLRHFSLNRISSIISTLTEMDSRKKKIIIEQFNRPFLFQFSIHFCMPSDVVAHEPTTV